MSRKIGLLIGIIIVLALVYRLAGNVPLQFAKKATTSRGNGWCHAKEPTKSVKTTNPVPSPDGQRFAFVQTVETYHKPVGICTFPDGGWVNVISKELKLYTASLDNPNPQLETAIDLGLQGGTGIAVIDAYKWEGDSITIHDWNGDDNGSPAIKTYQLNTKQYIDTGTEGPRPDTPEQEKLVRPDTHLPQDKTLRLITDTNNTIGLYRDKTLPNGEIDWDLEKLLITSVTLKSLNPGAEFYF